MKSIDEHTLRTIMRDTVHETLMGLGFNVRDQHSMQADLAHLHRMRTWHEERFRITLQSVITFLIPVMFYGAWEVIKDYVVR